MAKLQFDDFVEVLARTRKAQPVLVRIPLLHWLTVWAAERDGSAVACPKIQSHDPPGKEVGKIPGPSPLGKREWELELQRRVDDKSVLAPDAIVALRAKEAPGSEVAPTWLSMLDAPLDVDDEGLEQQLESLANLTDIAAAHTARSLHALSRRHAVPARPLQALQSAVSGATLAAAARSAWAACPTFNRPAMRQELTKFLQTVANRFGSNLKAPDANHQTLKDVQQLLVQAERDGITDWRAVAIDFFKDGDLLVAFTNSFAPVRDLRGLRQALWDGVEHHLVSPGEPRQALAVLKRSLASRLGQRDRASADWFLAGALQPTDSLPAYHQSQVGLPLDVRGGRVGLHGVPARQPQPRHAGGAHLASGPRGRNRAVVRHVPCPRRTHLHHNRRSQPGVRVRSSTGSQVRGNLPGRVGGPTRVRGSAREEHHAGVAVSDHRRALRLGHPAGFDHAAITASTRLPREVRQQTPPSPTGDEGEQKGARAAGHQPARHGAGAGPPLSTTRILTTAAPASRTGGLVPARSTRS